MKRVIHRRPDVSPSRDVSAIVRRSPAFRAGPPSRAERVRILIRRLEALLEPRIEAFGRALWDEEPNAVIGLAIALVIVGGAVMLLVDLAISAVRAPA